MLVELDAAELDVLITSLEYSKKNVREGSAPYELRTRNLATLDTVALKLREARKKA